MTQITKLQYEDKLIKVSLCQKKKKVKTHLISLQQQMSNPYRLNTTSKHINPIFLQSISPTNIKAKSLQNIPKNKKNLYPYILSILFIKRIKNSIKRRKHREKILQQWYVTQHSYHLDLEIAINFIKIPLQTANIVNQQQAQILFPQIYSMIKLSQMMLQVLQAVKKPGRIYQVYVGKQINKFVKHYKIYSKYFSSHAKRLQIISSLLEKHSKQLKKIQQNMQAQLTRRKSNKQLMSIKDCMDKPLYRIFKYVIILKQYIKKLDQNHKDYQYTIQCLNSFHQINQNNNQLMKKIEQKQKIIKLGKLFGSELGDNKQYITQIQANTMNNKIKLYIFNNILLITKIQQLLGSEIQSKYSVLQFNQFAYCADQDNLKYFKNIVILVSKFKCLHLFFDYQDSKIQFLVTIQNVIRRIRKIKYQCRNIMSCTLFNDQKVKVHHSSSNKQFQDRPKLVNVHPEFIVEIFGFQVRPLGTITHDTVYVARFMIPYYYEDQINLNKPQESLIIKQRSLTHLDNYKKRLSNTSHQSTQSSQTISVLVQDNYKISKLKRNYSINQKIQMHFSALQQIHRFVQSLCNQQIPQIDQTTSGSKKTKTFQQRKFVIQQFFNYILRNYAIMNNPNWIVQKLKINEDVWNYTARRNAQSKLNENTRVKSYGFDHCNICLNAKIKSIQQFQQLREHYLLEQSSKQKKQTDIYCMNFFNLLRLRIVNIKTTLFNTIERMVNYYHYKQGRIDYPFMLHRRYQQNVKVIKIFLTSVQQTYIEVQLDSRTTVGQVLDELGITLQLSNTFQFDLIATYAQKRRLLDRDQYMMDLIKVLQLKYQQFSIKNSQVRKKSKGSLFDTLKSFGTHIFQSSQQQNKIYIIKTIYLTKSLQLKSYLSNPKKSQLEVQKIFWVIKKGIIKLSFIQFIQLLAPYYCLKQYKEIMNKQLLRISTKKVQKLIPDQFSHFFYYDDQFINQFSSAVARQIQDMLRRNQSTSDKLYAKIIENSYTKPLFHTYFIEVEAKQIPGDWNHASEIPEICLLGINYCNLVIAKKEPNTKIIAQFPIQQLQYSLSVYSIFITYDSWNFRFDGKMLYHFGELIKKYQTLSRVFLQYMF